MSERDLNITFASFPHPDSTLPGWLKNPVNILPRVTPHVRSKEFLQRYLDKVNGPVIVDEEVVVDDEVEDDNTKDSW